MKNEKDDMDDGWQARKKPVRCCLVCITTNMLFVRSCSFNVPTVPCTDLHSRERLNCLAGNLQPTFTCCILLLTPTLPATHAVDRTWKVLEHLRKLNETVAPPGVSSKSKWSSEITAARGNVASGSPWDRFVPKPSSTHVFAILCTTQHKSPL